MDRALDLMMAARGSHFDPEPLDALLELLDQEGIRVLGVLGATDGQETTEEACHPAGRPSYSAG
jgi:HD-GYP domain-containing protein (c-di-GMP phosphodiesterase class II)